MTSPLPRLHTVEDVAAALRETPRYVREKARLREWPHRRLARGAVAFTDDDFAQVLELIKEAPAVAATPRLAFAPRSGRRAS
jgi:hypothetical protein